MSREVNAITCSVWVPRGIAKSDPDKVEITKEELEKIIEETTSKIDDLEVEEEDIDEDDYERLEEVEEKPKLLDEDKENTKDEVLIKKEDIKEEDIKKEENIKKEDVEKEETLETSYDLDNYDEEDDEGESSKNLMNLGKLIVHPSSEEDPFITVKDDDDVDSEVGDDKILKTDNLVVMGHVDGDAAILEVHVYNSEEVNYYVHHDIFLPAIPLCLEWLNYEPGEDKPSNLVAIGSMSPIIDIWDLDVVDSLEPVFTLGKKAKKKKKILAVGHKDAVLSLAWNQDFHHIMASGSADSSVILWDIEQGSVSQQMRCFQEKVQALKWHPKQPHLLLTGCCDGKVRLHDFRAGESGVVKTWQTNGEVEAVYWDPFIEDHFLASTDAGTVYSVDFKKEKPLWNLNAHSGACTGVSMSPSCPGCLVTCSADETLKVWDIIDGTPKYIIEHTPKVGVIHTVTACPDEPFVFCVGGDNKSNNNTIVDIRHKPEVRSRFCERVGLPVDAEPDEEMNEYDEDVAVKNTAAAFNNISIKNIKKEKSIVEENIDKGWKPKKSKKKKGGLLDKKK